MKKYLKGVQTVFLHLNAQELTLHGHADSGRGGSSDKDSISGYVIMLGNALIYWKCAKHTCTALVNKEAEYIGLSAAARESTRWLELLSRLGYHQKEATIILQDNKGSIAWAEDASSFKRNKHIEIPLHHVPDLI